MTTAQPRSYRDSAAFKRSERHRTRENEPEIAA
jgi:hypothetical protein